MKDNIMYNQTYEKFKLWRLEKASRKGMPPYIIVHNKVIENIIANNPKSVSDLFNIKGLGTSKINEYGDEIINLLKNSKSINSNINNSNNNIMNYNFHNNIYLNSIKKCVPAFSWNKAQWERTGRGKLILSNDAQCDIYNKYYAGRHSSVLNHQLDILLEKIKFDEKLKLRINDYGSGQGFATFLLIENLFKKKIKIDSITINLIEPSLIALNRSKKYIKKLLIANNILCKEKIKIRCIKTKLSGLSKSSFFKEKLDKTFTNVHLFSNILDIKSVDICKLYQDIKNFYNHNNLILANSPVYYDTLDRINMFKTLFQNEEKFNSLQKLNIYNIVSKQYFFKINSRKLTKKNIKYCGLIFKAKL